MRAHHTLLVALSASSIFCAATSFGSTTVMAEIPPLPSRSTSTVMFAAGATADFHTPSSRNCFCCPLMNSRPGLASGTLMTVARGLAALQLFIDLLLFDLGLILPQLPIFLIAPSSVCNVPSLLISIGWLNGVNEPAL